MRLVSREADLIKTTSRTYTGRNMAHVDGTNPSTGEYKYYTLDHLGSTRDVWNQSKTAYAVLEYDPYGIPYATSGAAAYIDRRYTGHLWDATSQLYAAPYRAYSPTQSRWTTRDPLGMVDGPTMYGYVGGNPMLFMMSVL
jgi:RHS repeat-associated protein